MAETAHGTKDAAASAIAPVTVYLDLENQIGAAQVRDFMQKVREHVKGQQVDLLYYSNAAGSATGELYKALWRYGFRAMDVPYKGLGVKTIKNILDVELSLHAYQRALLGPERQDIVLVAEDQDYIPLVYRLCELGHKVSVSASELPHTYKSLEPLLGITCYEFGSKFGKTVSPAEERARNLEADPRSSIGSQVASHTKSASVVVESAAGIPISRDIA
jgi:NYN domain